MSDNALPQRLPPHNFEAEQALLGALLLNNKAHERVSEFLRPEHFAHAAHGRIFAAAGRLIERGQIANPTTLKGFFEQDDALAEVGGTEYLARLAASAISIINAEDYGKLIFDLHMRRELISLGEDVVNEDFTPDLETSALDQVAQTEARLYELATTGQIEGGFQSFDAVLVNAIASAEAAHKRGGKLAGVPTGLTDLDKRLGGLHPSDLIILAGRPSMGKTALATNIAFNAALRYRWENNAQGQRKTVDGGQIAFFSLEMSAEQLATRILAERTGVMSHKIRQGDLNEQEIQKIIQASQELQTLSFYIDDTPALSIANVRTRARRLQRQKGLDMVVIDYLQLLRGSSKIENRVQEISEITRGLKALAKELHIPVIALSQLSRAVEARDDKRPQLSDLRESGSIEQDADVVMFVYREQYYLERAEPNRRPEEDEAKFSTRYAGWQDRCNAVWNTAEAIIAKQRHGPVGTVKLYFDGNITKFSDLIQDDMGEDEH